MMHPEDPTGMHGPFHRQMRNLKIFEQVSYKHILKISCILTCYGNI